MKRVIGVFFSGTSTTKKIVRTIAKTLAEALGTEYEEYDFTNTKNRETPLNFAKEDIVVFGTPVYAGRVPNVLLKYLETIKGSGAVAVPIVVYGNRNYDDALIELRDILIKAGLHTVGAGAFVGEHSFSNILAKGRPDSKDITIAKSFALDIAEKLKHSSENAQVPVSGTPYPYRGYYRPVGSSGEFIDLRKVKPETTENCTSCGICANVCPMGSIDFSDFSLVRGICIKCCSCVKKCPTNAKVFTDENFIFHKKDLEKLIIRREPEIFL